MQMMYHLTVLQGKGGIVGEEGWWERKAGGGEERDWEFAFFFPRFWGRIFYTSLEF